VGIGVEHVFRTAYEEGDDMLARTVAMICVVVGLVISVVAPSTMADGKNRTRVSVTASFEAGLNTAQPGNPENHVILPDRIKVKEGGVVNFLVAGFHQIFVYKPGTEPRDIDVPDSGTFINDLNNLYYQGLVPAGGPPPGLPITTDPSNARNRVESVSFAEPGTYLVICNVRGHFLDGMFAFVRVRD
jgi:hypothetical protein